jgi:hypothetical protein
MSDVILYAALKENKKLTAELELIQAARNNSLLEYGVGGTVAGGPYSNELLSKAGVCKPAMVVDWENKLKPFVETRANGLKICDVSGNFQQGASCTWTVPVGVTNVQFQLWGAGAGSGTVDCCGGSAFAPSGAYAVAKMDVTAGDTYQLESGCARLCYATACTITGLCGQGSSVIGNGITICAQGGISCYCHWGQDIDAIGLGASTCGLPYLQGDSCAPNSCAGYNFCWDTGNDNTDICHAFSRQTWVLPVANAACNVDAYGINGMWPSMYIGTNGLTDAYSVSAPVFGFENMTCCKVWTALSTSGLRASAGVQAGPGFGGFASAVRSGITGMTGDSGGMGMICVSWN